MTVEIATDPDERDVEAIREGLTAFNERHTAPDGYAPLTAFVRDDDGAVCGGLHGETFWQWLHVSIVWVAEPHRGRGLGSELLRLAEQEAVGRGCIGAFLDTLSFHATGFYTKHGYTQWGEITDLPPGHARVFFQKCLVSS